MSLLGPVYVILSLSRRQEDALEGSWHALEGIQSATESVAFCLNTMLSKFDSSGLTPEQEQQVAALIAQLKQSGDALGAAEAAQP